MSSGSINLSTATPPANFIHYNPVRIDFAVSESELDVLKNGADSQWKDFCLACSSLGIPCIINAISEIRAMQTFSLTLSTTLNLIFGIVGIVLGVAFGIAWKRSASGVSQLILNIKGRPRIQI
jgi:hypothetical protein